MRDRLIELLEKAAKEMDCPQMDEVADFLLANGVVVLPCKVGDILYVISQTKDRRILPFINQYEVTSITIKKKSIIVYHEMDGYIKTFKQTDFGKTVFLTKEEAEKALERSAQ